MTHEPPANEPVDAGVRWLTDNLTHQGYLPHPDLSLSLFLMRTLEKPLLIEGEAGVGKTAVAKALAGAHDCELIRLQCHEGLDAQHALYDWDYQKQLISIQAQREHNVQTADLYTEDFLLPRPILRAIATDRPVVLLIDEVDRADEAFEALLLEVLSDFQISVPELGTYTARSRPYVILTTNGVRDLSDALRRRCLYHYLDYPNSDHEQAIIQRQFPRIEQQLALQVIQVMQRLRAASLARTPGIAETLDWVAALQALGASELKADDTSLNSTLGCIVKTQEDQARISGQYGGLHGLFAAVPAG